MTASATVMAMKMLLVVAMLIAVGCKKKSSYVPIGGACEQDYQCDYMNAVDCFESKCRPRAADGGRCHVDSHCTSYLCVDKTCVSPEQKRQLEAEAAARAAEAARKAEVEKEQRLLKEGGIIDTAPIAEVPTIPTALPPGPGQRVRTVELKANGSAFAPCKRDERLIGGGCRSVQPMLESHPSHHGAEDTMGARWNCRIALADYEVTAFALCLKP